MRNIKIKTSDIITQKELENGLWQFMIDHAVPFEKGLWQVKYLPITTKQDLMRRIYSRATNLYKIKDEDKIERELKKRIEYLQSLLNNSKDVVEKQKRIHKLESKSLWRYKIIIFLRKLLNKLIKKWCYEI